MDGDRIGDIQLRKNGKDSSHRKSADKSQQKPFPAFLYAFYAPCKKIANYGEQNNSHDKEQDTGDPIACSIGECGSYRKRERPRQ